jgi:hypothetical protein
MFVVVFRDKIRPVNFHVRRFVNIPKKPRSALRVQCPVARVTNARCLMYPSIIGDVRVCNSATLCISRYSWNDCRYCRKFESVRSERPKTLRQSRYAVFLQYFLMVYA